MPGNNVLNREQYDRFLNFEQILESKEQEISNIKKELSKLQRDLHHIQEGLLSELGTIISKSDLQEIQKISASYNETLSLGVATDLLIDEILSVLKKERIQTSEKLDSTLKEVKYLQGERARLKELLEKTELEQEETHSELESAEIKIKDFRKNLESTREINKILRESLEDSMTGDNNAAVSQSSSDTKEIENLKRSKVIISKLISKNSKLQDQLQSTTNKQTVDMTENSHAIQKMIDYIAKLVPRFSGAPSPSRPEELRRYLETSKIYYDTLGNDDKPNFIKFLIILTLTGEASNLFLDKSINTFEELRQTLSNNYMPTKTLTNLCDDLRSCVQLTSEKISDFGRRILDKKALCKIAIDELYPKEKEGFNKEYDTIALKTFKQGLKDQVFRQHALLQEGSLEDLIKKLGGIEETDINQQNGILNNQQIFSFNNPAVRSTTINDNNNSRQSGNRQYHQSNGSQGNNNFNNFKQQNNYRNTGNNYSNTNRNFNQRINNNSFNQNSPVICYTCGSPGHISRECRNSKRNGQLTCYSCGIPGHISRDCGNRGQRTINNNTFAKPVNHNYNNQNSQQNTLPGIRMARADECTFCRRTGHDISNCHPKILWEQSQREQSGNGYGPVVSTPTSR